MNITVVIRRGKRDMSKREHISYWHNLVVSVWLFVSMLPIYLLFDTACPFYNYVNAFVVIVVVVVMYGCI